MISQRVARRDTNSSSRFEAPDYVPYGLSKITHDAISVQTAKSMAKISTVRKYLCGATLPPVHARRRASIGKRISSANYIPHANTLYSCTQSLPEETSAHSPA